MVTVIWIRTVRNRQFASIQSYRIFLRTEKPEVVGYGWVGNKLEISYL